MQDTSSYSTPPPIPGAPSTPQGEGAQQQNSQRGDRPQHRGNRRPRNRRPFQRNKDRRNFRPNREGQESNGYQGNGEAEFVPHPEADPNAEPTFAEGIV
ncbi:MAG: hypothetical protein FJ390_07685, partial [Verrucomicrobia bacterium]|nr:hypothetical protein [Verrucomicrobiota bacterium]